MKYDGIVRTRISEVVSIPSSGPTGYVRSANGTAVSGGRDNVHMLESRNVMEGGLSHTQVCWVCVGWKSGISLMLFRLFWGWKITLPQQVAERTGGARAVHFVHYEFIQPFTRRRLLPFGNAASLCLGSFLSIVRV